MYSGTRAAVEPLLVHGTFRSAYKLADFLLASHFDPVVLERLHEPPYYQLERALYLAATRDIEAVRVLLRWYAPLKAREILEGPANAALLELLLQEGYQQELEDMANGVVTYGPEESARWYVTHFPRLATVDNVVRAALSYNWNFLRAIKHRRTLGRKALWRLVDHPLTDSDFLDYPIPAVELIAVLKSMAAIFKLPGTELQVAIDEPWEHYPTPGEYEHALRSSPFRHDHFTWGPDAITYCDTIPIYFRDWCRL
jgi:hypothetical protein